ADTVSTTGIFSHLTVASAGTPASTGGVLSTTVKVCVAVVVLPHASVAVQVLVIVPQPSKTDEVPENVTGTVGSQLSVAVTVAAAGILSHCTVAFAGTPASTGGVLSTTVKV